MHFETAARVVRCRLLLAGYLLALINIAGGCAKNPSDVFERNNPLDPDGTILRWLVQWGGAGDDIMGSALPLTDGGCIVTGSTTSYGNGMYDAYLVRFRADGSMAWSTTYGGTSYDNGNCIAACPDGGVVLCGMSRPDGGGQSSLLLVKFTANGDTVWARRHSGGNETFGCWIESTPDGGYIISGYVSQVGGYLAKVDANGTIVWWRGINGNGDMVKPSADGGYYVISGASFIRTDSLGTVIWEHAPTSVSVVEPTPDGGYLAAAGDLIVKRDASDLTQWSLYASGVGRELIKGLRALPGGGYAAVGVDFADQRDAHLLMINADGTLRKEITFPGVGYPMLVMPAAGGGCFVAGNNSAGAIFLLKTKPGI